MNRKWIIIGIIAVIGIGILAMPRWMWRGNRSLTEINELRNRGKKEEQKQDVELSIPKELIPFVNLRNPDINVAREAFMGISNNWNDSYAVMILELRGIIQNPHITQNLIKLLEDKTSRSPSDIVGMYRWIWGPKVTEHPRYAEFKSLLYNGIDTRFRKVFSPRPQAQIDLRELLFNGSHDDRVPSIQQPQMVTRDKATELRDSHMVVGIMVDGVAKAYPRKMLAHHEVVKDQIGKSKILLVDCVISGTVTAFSSTSEKLMDFFSSGFIYRSHKVLMDPSSSTLWSSVTGERIVGPKTQPLVRHPVVITTWGEWKQRHPNTWILNPKKPKLGSREIDYSGMSPRDQYLDNDTPAAPIPEVATSLKNKTDVLVIPKQEPVAIAINYRKKHSLFHYEDVVVLSNKVGASRVYLADAKKFTTWDGKSTVTDSKGGKWQVTESGLVGPDKKTACPRVTSYNTFWFAWNVLHPKATLLK